MSNRLIDIVDITKSYGDSVILDQLNLYIRENEFLTLLGPSGCGKTTLLRILGGFETPDSGKIIFDGKNINDIPPNRRQLNTVFQKYALFSPRFDICALLPLERPVIPVLASSSISYPRRRFRKASSLL